MIDFSRIEYEKMERAAIRILYESLNDEIASQATEWAAEDAAFAAAMDRTVVDVTVEEIEAQNFYVGHTPTLINAPVDRYPNVSALAFKAEAVRAGDDHMEKYNVHLTIEIMCKAVGTTTKPDVDADIAANAEVNSRIKRTLAAAHRVMMSDDARSLGGIIPKLGDTPNSLITDVFVRREEQARGARWFWQGGALEYIVENWITY